jgi:protein-S-isoprenylcysteine O-methyltransferase Ste14
MSATFQKIVNRGAGWVITQFTLMFALLAAGPAWRGHGPGSWTWAPATALLVVGAWAGLAGKRALGPQRTPFPEPRPNAALVTTGIYASIRHPLYLAVMALGLAWALGWRSGPALALAALQIPFFDAKARREERWLRERFPEYRDYARRTRRFIPGVY